MILPSRKSALTITLTLSCLIPIVWYFLFVDTRILAYRLNSENPYTIGSTLITIKKRHANQVIPEVVRYVNDHRNGTKGSFFGKGASISYLANDCLKSMRSESLKYLLAQWNDTSQTRNRRTDLAQALCELLSYSEAQVLYESMLRDPDMEVRKIAINHISYLNDRTKQATTSVAKSTTLCTTLERETRPEVVKSLLYQISDLHLREDIPDSMIPLTISFLLNEDTNYPARRLLEILTYNRCLGNCKEPEIAASFYREFWKDWQSKPRIQWFRLSLSREIQAFGSEPIPTNSPTYWIESRLFSLTPYGTSREDQVSAWEDWWRDYKEVEDLILLKSLLERSRTRYLDDTAKVINLIGSFCDERFLELLKLERENAVLLKTSTSASKNERERAIKVEYAANKALTRCPAP